VPRPRPKSEVSPKWHCEVTSYDRRDKNKHTKSGGEHKILRQLVVRLHSQLPVRYRAACCLALEYGRTSGVRISTGEKEFSLLQNVQKTVAPTQPPSIVIGVPVPRAKRPTAHFYLVPRFRMSVAVLLRPLYAFITWAGTTVPFLD